MGIVEAGCSTAYFANKMNMIIVVVTLTAVLPAQCIPCCIVCSGYGMNDPFIYESLQRAIYRNPVKPVTGYFLNIIMSKRIVRLKEYLQYSPAGVGITEMISF